MKNNLLRVTQVNAAYLDQEIEKSFQQIVQEACKHLPPGFVSSIGAEINLILRLGILKYSVLSDGCTFGQRLLNIQYENIGTLQKVLYLMLSNLDYIKARSELWNPSHYVNRVIFKWYIVLKILDFINTSVFLRSGAKPLLIERVLGLNQVYASEQPPRTFQSKYLARELLWNGFIEILVHMVPLINYYKLKRFIKDYNPFRQSRAVRDVVSSRVMTANSKCAHCQQSPILPHHMGCSHVFCYVCLRGNQAADPKYECPSCERRNPSAICERVSL